MDLAVRNDGSFFFHASASVCLFAEREQRGSAAKHVSELRKKAERNEASGRRKLLLMR